MGDACEMLIAAEMTFEGVPAQRVTENWPGYDVIAQPINGPPQRISVKSRTPGPRHSRLGFDPETCDWLAIVLILQNRERRCFVLSSNVAKKHASKQARKGKPYALSFAKLQKQPELLRYKDNFKLDPDPPFPK